MGRQPRHEKEAVTDDRCEVDDRMRERDRLPGIGAQRKPCRSHTDDWVDAIGIHLRQNVHVSKDRVELIDKCRRSLIVDPETRQSILLALAASRTEAAMEFLLDVIRNGSSRSSEIAVSAMQVNSADAQIREKIQAALRERRSA